MKKHHFLLVFLILLSCQLKQQRTANTSSPPHNEMYEQSRRNNVRLNAILDSTVIRMLRVELTNHPVKDFAMLMRVHNNGIRQFIEKGSGQIKDASLKTMVQQIDRDVKEEMVMLNRFILDNRFQKQVTASPVSHKLMESISTIKQPFPASGDQQKDFAVLLIQLLQSTNDMVQVMRDEEADYAISDFTEQMVPRNNAHIEQLRGWVSPGK